MNKNAAMKGGGGMLYAAIVSYLLFSHLSFAVLCGKKSLCPFLLVNSGVRLLRCPKATGVFAYSGQEVKNTLPHLLCSFACFVFFWFVFLIHVP